jgi:hypothetical protein
VTGTLLSSSSTMKKEAEMSFETWVSTYLHGSLALNVFLDLKLLRFELKLLALLGRMILGGGFLIIPKASPGMTDEINITPRLSSVMATIINANFDRVLVPGHHPVHNIAEATRQHRPRNTNALAGHLLQAGTLIATLGIIMHMLSDLMHLHLFIW